MNTVGFLAITLTLNATQKEASDLSHMTRDLLIISYRDSTYQLQNLQ